MLIPEHVGRLMHCDLGTSGREWPSTGLGRHPGKPGIKYAPYFRPSPIYVVYL